MEAVKTLRLAAGVLGVALLAGSADAHETWLALSKTPDGRLVADIATGNKFPISDNAVKPERIERAVARGGSSYVAPMTNARVEGNVTRLDVPASAAEQAIVGVELFPRPISIEATRFEKYLEEIGATAALEERKRRGETAKAGREVYVKLPKAVAYRPASTETTLALPIEFFLEQVDGPNVGQPAGRQTGNPLFIHPTTRRPVGKTPIHASARITLLRRTRPVRNQFVRAWDERGRLIFSGETDLAGGIFLPLPLHGRVLVAATIFERIPDSDKARGEPYASADWQSFWASLFFEVP